MSIASFQGPFAIVVSAYLATHHFRSHDPTNINVAHSPGRSDVGSGSHGRPGGELVGGSDRDNNSSAMTSYAYPNMRKDTIVLLTTLADRWDVTPGRLHFIFDQTTAHHFWANLKAFSQRHPHLSLEEALACLRAGRTYNLRRQKRRCFPQQAWWPSDVTMAEAATGTAQDLIPTKTATEIPRTSWLGSDDEDGDDVQDAHHNSVELVRSDDANAEHTDSEQDNSKDINNDDLPRSFQRFHDDNPLDDDDTSHTMARKAQLKSVSRGLGGHSDSREDSNDRKLAHVPESPKKERHWSGSDTEVFSTPPERPSKRPKIGPSGENRKVGNCTAKSLSLSHEQITSLLVTIAALRPDEFQVALRPEQPPDARETSNFFGHRVKNATPTPSPTFLAPLHLRDNHWALAALDPDAQQATIYNWTPALRGLVPEALQAACAGLSTDRPFTYTFDATRRIIAGQQVDGGVPVVAAACFLVSHSAVPALMEVQL